MVILGIETSCDETAAAVVQKEGERVRILSNVVASSAVLQAKYGGVIPEQAAREQIKAIIPVIEEALNRAFTEISLGVNRNPPPRWDLIDAIAVTYGPGLIGSLLVGVETAKTLSMTWNRPLIPVNHLLAHFYANWITNGSGFKKHEAPRFPCIGLLISGGHTDLVLFTEHGKYQYLGGTRDDAAGECFDKCARLLGLPYPGGPAISKLAKKGNPIAFNLPRPMIDSDDFDFSFSGLKTAVARIAGGGERIADLAASVEQAIIDVLMEKTILAAQKYKVKQIMVAGGVASNQKLTFDLNLKIKNLKLKIGLWVPPAELCTDNAAMIAAAASFNKKPVAPEKLQATPNLSLA